jgi:hypothetical protein
MNTQQKIERRLARLESIIGAGSNSSFFMQSSNSPARFLLQIIEINGYPVLKITRIGASTQLASLEVF